MSDLAIDSYGYNSRSDNVIRFPSSDTTSSGSESELENAMVNAFSNPEFENKFKGMIEAAVFDAWIKKRLLDDQPRDDPFDAIYISELKSDKVEESDIKRIYMYHDIYDLSNEIQFNDGWDE